jgi:hypothetical protein
MNDTHVDLISDATKATQKSDKDPDGPVDDYAQKILYEICRQHSQMAYDLVRRLAVHGLTPDPPYPDGPIRSSTPRGVVWNGRFYRGSYITFNDGHKSQSGKTKTWNVTNAAGRSLGAVRWWASWRRYCFFPADDTVLEQVCMREIAVFIEERTREHWR